MMKKILTIVLICLVSLQLIHAQDFLKPLDHNPVINKFNSSFNTKSNTPFDACIGGLPFLNIELNDTIAPSAGNADGTLILDVFTNLDQVDFFVNGTFYGSSNGESTFSLENYAAGVYSIEATGEYELTDELFLGLSNNELEGVTDAAFTFTEEFCGEGGSIIYLNPLTPEAIIYDLYDFDGNYLYTFDTKVDTFEVPAGKYYATYFDRFGDLDEFFIPVEVPIETEAPFPFFDDFSDTQIIPNAARWKDRSAYINRTLAYAPPSLGVATLDGLNEDGLPYFPADIQIDGIADQFHSNRFCMDGIAPEDSLYFSFYYQGKGNGDYPNTDDSLIVEFLNKDGEWIQQWGTKYEFDETIPVFETGFEQVVIPMNDSMYFFKGFQFRFSNKATLNGQNDHWHIDYVELDSYPSGFDATIDDITFMYPAPSILATYSSMPWYQFEGFEEQELFPQFLLPVRNNKGTPTAINTSAEVFEVCTNELINSLENFGFRDYDSLEIFIADFTPSNYLPSAPDENVVLDFTFNIEDDGDDVASNNTLTHRQFFSNYLSYDDGTPELAIGYEKNGAQLAQKYYLNKPDTLVGLMIYFTHIVEDVSDNEFYLMAWNSINLSDNQALEDDVIARSLSTKNPIYTDGLNQFTVYEFDEPVAVTDSFYVGYQQVLDKNLSVGFDVYSPYILDDAIAEYSKSARLNTYFNDQAVWENSSYEGAAMIRPILSSTQDVVATNIEATIELNKGFSIFPNPASDQITLEFGSGNESGVVSLYSLDGKLLIQKEIYSGASINIENLTSGMYITNLQSGDKNMSTKFLKE